MRRAEPILALFLRRDTAFVEIGGGRIGGVLVLCPLEGTCAAVAAAHVGCSVQSVHPDSRRLAGTAITLANYLTNHSAYRATPALR